MKKSEKITKGYKITDENMKCRHYQFELGKRHKESGEIVVCRNGFHFCELTNSCFEYYSFDPKNRVFEVVAYGEVKTENDKSCCLEIELVRELSWLEVLTLCNTGKDNTGRSNSGDSNSGNWNSGNSNSGNWNSGDSNSGDSNSGYRNSGDSNSGDSNSGYRNSGDSNSGNWNSGDSNSGNWNSGNRNSGDSNSGYRNSGAFCINTNPKLVLFDKPCKSMTVREWEQSEACNLMYSIDTTIWVDSSIMTPEEKLKHPKHETTGGYLKTIPYKKAWSNFWGNLSDSKKKVFTSLENFNAKIFKEITGIDV